jgi:hypothetical protein
VKPATKRFLRSLLVRPARDNTTRWGFLFYFALVVFILVLGYVIMRPKGYQATLPAAASMQKAQVSKVETRRAVNAGENFISVAPLNSPGDNPLAESERVENNHAEQTVVAESAVGPGFLDTVRMATAQSEPAHDEPVPSAQKYLVAGEPQAAEVIDEHGAGISAEGASLGEGAREAGAGQPLRTGQPLQVQTGSLDVATLTVYKREADVAGPAKRPSGFDTGNFLPKGQLIPVIFQTNVTTLDLSGMVEMQVAENVKFNGDVIRLPYGTKIYGSASTKNVADRIAITANTIVFTDGTELHLDGVALDSDARAGVRGYYVPQPAAVQLFPYANEAASGALQTLGQSQQVTTQSALGLTTSSVQNPNSWRNSLVNAGQQALQDAFNREQAMLDQRYPAYVIVKRGTMAYVQLSSALDLNAGKIFQPQEEPKPADAAPAQSGFSPQLPPALRDLLQKLQSTVPSS